MTGKQIKQELLDLMNRYQKDGIYNTSSLEHAPIILRMAEVE